MRLESELSPNEKRRISEILANRDPNNYSSLGPEIGDKTRELWTKFLKAAFLTTKEEQEAFVKVYAENIAGTPWDDSNIGTSLDLAGQRLNGYLGNGLFAGGQFYLKLHQAIPGLFNDKDLKWLVENDTSGSGGLELLCAMEFFSPKSSLPRDLGVTIHFYK